jgi:UDP-N-acetylmuramate--alanine ligase
VRNATAALAATVSLGGDAGAAVSALGRFAGVARRFEFRGERAEITVVDDSARLPAEVRATVDAAAAGPWRRVVAVFQAHGYERVEWLWQEFGAAFDAADVTVIVEPQPVFGETPRPGVSGMTLVRGVLEHRPRAEVAYVPDRDGLLAFLSGRLRPGDVCVVMQAGGALTDFPDELLGVLAAREGRRGVA